MLGLPAAGDGCLARLPQLHAPHQRERRRPGHPAPYTLHPTPYTLHPPPCTLHPTPYTPHPAPYTLHPTPFTLHPNSYTLHPTPSGNPLCSAFRAPSPARPRYRGEKIREDWPDSLVSKVICASHNARNNCCPRRIDLLVQITWEVQHLETRSTSSSVRVQLGASSNTLKLFPFRSEEARLNP